MTAPERTARTARRPRHGSWAHVGICTRCGHETPNGYWTAAAALRAIDQHTCEEDTHA